jgi:Ferritin-like domain
MMDNSLTSSRRSLLGFTGKALLSASAIAVLGGSEALAAMKGRPMKATKGDVDILNIALGLEHEAIEAYQIGAESGLLAKPVLDVAVLFQGHHKGHRDALMGAIRQMGGVAVAPKSRADYVTGLNVAAIQNATDILRLAQRLEKGAANAYLGVIPAFADKGLAQISAKLAADETAHWTALSSSLGESLPTKPFILE